MTDSAIVFRYSRAAPGREEQALEAFMEGMAFFASAAHDGMCEPPINFMGPSGYSLLIVPGQRADLARLVASEGFSEMYMKTVFAVPDIGYELGDFGQGVQARMAQWARVGHELALM